MEKSKEIMLIITENCNLACSYCFEHHKTSKIMDYNTAVSIIDNELEMDDGFEECIVTLFGGEPFLEFELIQKIYEYVSSKQWKKKVVLFTTTNGTLLTEDTKKWLRARRKYFYCGLSLDGTREMHNINRSNSFDEIDLEFFKECWPDQPVKMTVSKETLPRLAEGVIFIHELGYKCGCTFAYGIEWNEELVGILEKELEKLILYYKENPDKELCQMLDLKLEDIGKKKGEDFKNCGAGTSVRAYDTKGQLYPCQTFSPISLGNEAEKFVNYSLPVDDIKEESACLECKYHVICPTCYGVNYIYTKSVAKRSKWLCEFFKLCVQASAVINLHRLSQKKSVELTEKDYQVLNAIKTMMS